MVAASTALHRIACVSVGQQNKLPDSGTTALWYCMKGYPAKGLLKSSPIHQVLQVLGRIESVKVEPRSVLLCPPHDQPIYCVDNQRVLGGRMDTLVDEVHTQSVKLRKGRDFVRKLCRGKRVSTSRRSAWRTIDLILSDET